MLQVNWSIVNPYVKQNSVSCQMFLKKGPVASPAPQGAVNGPDWSRLAHYDAEQSRKMLSKCDCLIGIYNCALKVSWMRFDAT